MWNIGANSLAFRPYLLLFILTGISAVLLLINRRSTTNGDLKFKSSEHYHHGDSDTLVVYPRLIRSSSSMIDSSQDHRRRSKRNAGRKAKRKEGDQQQDNDEEEDDDRSTDEEDSSYYLYSINAFDREILLNLSRFTRSHGSILAPNFLIQHYNSHNFTWFENDTNDDDENDESNSDFTRGGRNRNETRKLSSTSSSTTTSALTTRSMPDRCLFIGRVILDNKNETTTTNDGGATLLNLCHGMYGTLELPQGTYFLEPLLPNGTTSDRGGNIQIDRRLGGGAESTRPKLPHDQPHLLYRHRSQTFHDYDYDSDGKKRSPLKSLASKKSWKNHHKRRKNMTLDNDDTNLNPNFGGKHHRHHHRPKRSYSWDHYIEVLVVADARMKQYHGSNLENYILTLLSIVATVYRHPSLEAALNIIVVRLIVLDHENAGPHISENAQDTLKQFCRWQQSLNDPDDESINHHDVAILLTRHDICRAPGKCDTLGLAELGTMCDPYRSCAIIEDNGLSAAFTIAHELGHIFNIPHDDEKKCGHHMSLDKYNFHIMAPTLEFNTHPWSWSPCSAAMLHKFLDSGRAHCLLDKPVQQKYVDNSKGNPAPGLTFTVDQQCQFVFGSSATLCPYMPACKRLWCATVYQYQVGCRTQHMPWADGTPCGYSRWCYRGECVGVSPAQMTPIDGAWGRWKEWGECSRTCGGGVKRSLRDCDNPRPSNGGRYCTGERVRYRPCNTKECPLDSMDYREAQCAEFNNKRVGIHGLPADNNRWVPKYSGVSVNERCKLFCRATGSAQFYMLKDKVVDGTPCGRYSDDMCVDGVCKKAGCDHRLDSAMSRDDCGMCGGDGASCRRVSGTVNETLSYGYNKVMKIPTGAATIDIRQRSWNNRHEDDNYLALMNARGEWILNGHFQISAYHVEIPVLGTVLHYSGSESVIERINSSRPAMEDIYVHVLSVGQLHAPDLRYDYAISDRPFLTMQAPDHFWRATEEWSECSKPCQGLQSRRMVCVEAYEEEIVNERHCHAQPKPNDESRVCSSHCQLKWLTETTAECSASCGAGEQSQRTFCVAQSSTDGTKQAVDERYCYETAPRPPHRIPCYKDCAGRHWAYGEWDQCSASCGGGKQTRTAHCVDQNNQRMDTRYCENLITDVLTQDCNVFQCPQWHFGEWSKCSHTCDGGSQVRLSSCQDASGRDVDARFCDPNQRSDRRKCNEQLCTSWKFSSWSECSKTCGDGVATRDAWCVDSRGNALDESMCEKPQKIVSKSCRLDTCPHWKLSEWSSCSRTCLDGWMSRRVQCVDSKDQELDSKYCLGPGEQPPPTHETCNHGPCPFWKAGDWGPCSVTCASGEQSRTVDCMLPSPRGEVVDAAYCRDQQQPIRAQKCTLLACPEWENGSWDSCSVPCGEGNQTRSVRCRYEDGNTADEHLCPTDRRPKNMRPCKKSNCPPTSSSTTSTTVASAMRTSTNIDGASTTQGSSTQWISGGWSECTSTCGAGERMRLVICRDVFGRVLPDLYCAHSTRPTDHEFCSNGPCTPVGEWHVGPWEACSGTCGQGQYSSRRVTCVAQALPHPNSVLAPGNVLDTNRCKATDRPADRHPCTSLPPCPGNGAPGVASTVVESTTPTITSPITSIDHHRRKEANGNGNERDRYYAKWRVGEWGQCNKSCGGGVQRRVVECMDSETGQSLLPQRCSRPPPAPTQACNEHRCQRLIWRTGKWSACSVTCGRGVRTREIRCADEERANQNQNGTTTSDYFVNETLCTTEVAGEKPLAVLRCRPTKCPKWKRGKWSLCSATCGEGTRTRTVSCSQGRRSVLPDARCKAEGPKPSETARCHKPPCPIYHWFYTRWSKCSEVCGEGSQIREVYCVNNYRQRAPASSCNSSQKPSGVQRCVSHECPYTWMPGAWSTCSKSCGEGEQFRSLHCQLKVHTRKPPQSKNDVLELSAEDVDHEENGPQVPTYHCASLPQPTVRRACSLGSCDSDYFWHAESWSQCSVTCGWGMQTRRVRCIGRVSGRSVRGRCATQSRPKRKRRCFLRNCEPSDCSEVRQMFNTTTDGHYEILVSGRKVQIYCHAMNESYPKEYLTLRTGQRSNYAEFYGKRLLYPFTCPHNGERNDSCQCTSEMNPRPGLTRFTRVRIDLQNMKINVMDRQFAITEFGDFIPFGTAGDCYSAVNCPQGQFGVDLRTTGFKVSEKTEWQEDGHRAAKHITRYENGAAVHGRCGGFCGKCYPSKRHGLLVELDLKQLKK